MTVVTRLVVLPTRERKTMTPFLLRVLFKRTGTLGWFQLGHDVVRGVGCCWAASASRVSLSPFLFSVFLFQFFQFSILNFCLNSILLCKSFLFESYGDSPEILQILLLCNRKFWMGNNTFSY
jgi:hypothetical protein